MAREPHRAQGSSCVSPAWWDQTEEQVRAGFKALSYPPPRCMTLRRPLPYQSLTFAHLSGVSRSHPRGVHEEKQSKVHDERALGPLRYGADEGAYEYQFSSSRLALLDSPARFYTDWHQPETQLVNLLGYVLPGSPRGQSGSSNQHLPGSKPARLRCGHREDRCLVLLRNPLNTGH